MVDDWVVSQHRTMARWVSSKISQNVEDLTKDLADGLVLIELLNRIIDESGVSGYILTPIYTKPNFTLQKVENVDDFLKFCRLVLKINTCNISAEDIVGGNLKLILGLIWTLFVFLFSKLTAVSNDSRSIADIKTILLGWVNTVGRSRALPEVSNFNKDWSLQQDRRPDLIFASILDFYSPGVIDYRMHVVGKKYANLEEIIALAHSKLSIPNLAEPLDFNVLVPDEKCVILYLLQWYLYFEEADKSQSSEVEVLKSSQEQFMSFITHVIAAVKFRNKYETKALRLLNQIISNTSKLHLIREELETSELCDTLVAALNDFCEELPATEDLEAHLSQRQDVSAITSLLSNYFGILDRYSHFIREIKPVLSAQDLPDLHSLFRSTNHELQKSGISPYEPFKQLSLPVLITKFQSLDVLDTELNTLIYSQLKRVKESGLKNIDSNIEYLLSRAKDRGNRVSDLAEKYRVSLDSLLVYKAQLCECLELMSEKRSAPVLTAYVNSVDTLELPETARSPESSDFLLFRDLVDSLKNQKNLTFYDLKQFFKGHLASSQHKSDPVKEFTKLIPTRKLLVLSESDDFSGILALDDSDHSLSIFDRVLQTLEHKLSGNHNRLYDLTLFVSQLENGFCIHV